MSQSKTSASADVADTVDAPAQPTMTPEELAAWANSPEGLAAQAKLDSAAGKAGKPEGEYEPGSLLDIANRAGYDTSKPFGGLGDTEEAAYDEFMRRFSESVAESGVMPGATPDEVLAAWYSVAKTEPGKLDGETITEERDRWYTVVEYSEAFSKALEEFAKVNGTSKANIGRKALAQYIGFELEPEWANKTSGGGVKKYASKDEAKAALKVQAKVRQDRTKLAMAVVKLELTGKAGTPAHTAAKDALEAFVKAHPFA